MTLYIYIYIYILIDDYIKVVVYVKSYNVVTPLSIIYISARHISPYYFNSKICISVCERLELNRWDQDKFAKMRPGQVFVQRWIHPHHCPLLLVVHRLAIFLPKPLQIHARKCPCWTLLAYLYSTWLNGELYR